MDLIVLLLDDALPLIIGLLATFLAGQAVVLFAKGMNLIGVKIEEKDMLTLHKGVRTGVEYVFDKVLNGLLSEQEALAQAVDIARANNPKTFKKLKGAEQAAPAIAKAKLNEMRVLANRVAAD
jgi:hypothetical protein